MRPRMTLRLWFALKCGHDVLGEALELFLGKSLQHANYVDGRKVTTKRSVNEIFVSNELTSRSKCGRYLQHVHS